MGKRKIAKFLFAALTGAMLMAAPSTVLAYNSGYETEQVDGSVAGVANLRVQYRSGDPFITFDNALVDDEVKYQRVVIEWSETDKFADDKTTDYAYVYNYEDNRAYMYDLEPGKTYYARAYMRQTTYGYYDANGDWVDDVTKNGPMSRTITFTSQVPDVTIASCEVASNSVAFTFGETYAGSYDEYRDYAYVNKYNYDYNGDGKTDANDQYSHSYEYNASYERSAYENVTGFEIYRATGSGSYSKLPVAVVADTVYTDTNLKSNTSYRYKIRAYALDSEGKKIYGKYTYRRVTTWGRDLEVKATAKGSSSVKLTWKKVTGADGYRIYRYAGGGMKRVENGMVESYANYELIKTIKKGKTTSYTDKKLAKNETYSYIVVAYKTVSGSRNTMNIEGYASVALGGEFTGDFYLDTKVENADGSVTATWNKVPGAEGFVVEKQDSKTDAWTKVTTLGGTATSYRFAAAQEYSYYRIYAYAKNEVSNYNYVDTEADTPAYRTSGIKAAATADLTGVKVNWNQVQGAAYYKVYRSRQLGNYNAGKGYYNIPNGEIVTVVKTPGKLDATGTYYEQVPEYTDAIYATSVVDTYQGYQYLEVRWDSAAQKNVETVKTEEIQEAPAMGVRYYYYVQAFRQDGTPIVENITDEEWDDTTGTWKEVVRGTRTETYYRGGLSGKPASVVLSNVSLKKPTISKVTSTKKKQAVVSWKKVTGATRYYVYYSTKKNSGYTLAGLTTSTRMTVKNLTSGKKYYFKVKACTANAAGADVYSSLSSAKNKKIK